jgi:acyl-CoA dehydrogenase
MTPTAVAGDLVDAARRVAETIAAPAAESVDRDARFPHEAIAALREERMLGAFVPRDLGGRGVTIGELAASCEVLGRACASTAMIYAMHQIEVACLDSTTLTPSSRSIRLCTCGRGRLVSAGRWTSTSSNDINGRSAIPGNG